MIVCLVSAVKGNSCFVEVICVYRILTMILKGCCQGIGFEKVEWKYDRGSFRMSLDAFLT